MNCSRCGHAQDDGARFCSRCGLTLGGAAAPESLFQRPVLISILAVLYGLAAPFYLLAAIGGLAMTKDPKGGAVAGIIIAISCFAMAAVSAWLAWGLWTLRPAARTVLFVVSCIGLLAFPLGTIVSGLVLYYITRPGIIVLFSGRRGGELSAADVAALQSANSGGGAVIIVAVVCLAVIVMGGILAAIAIPNLLTAMQRAKQKRTMADMAAISEKVGDYVDQHNRFPNVRTMEELAKVLGTTLPAADGWGNKMQYGTDGMRFWLISAGRDGKFEEADEHRFYPGETSSFDSDIVLANGEFVRKPQFHGYSGKR